jgi:hypothetical protein
MIVFTYVPMPNRRRRDMKSLTSLFAVLTLIVAGAAGPSVAVGAPIGNFGNGAMPRFSGGGPGGDADDDCPPPARDEDCVVDFAEIHVEKLIDLDRDIDTLEDQVLGVAQFSLDIPGGEVRERIEGDGAVSLIVGLAESPTTVRLSEEHEPGFELAAVICGAQEILGDIVWDFGFSFDDTFIEFDIETGQSVHCSFVNIANEAQAPESPSPTPPDTRAEAASTSVAGDDSSRLLLLLVGFVAMAGALLAVRRTSSA